MKALTEKYIQFWKGIYAESGISMKEFYIHMYERMMYLNILYPDSDRLKR